jgi:acyl carrier protein
MINKGENAMSINERVLKCIEENGIVVLEDGNFDNMDSINFISAVISIESEFDIEFPDEYLLMSTFCDFKNVVLIVVDISDKKSENK